MNIKQKINLLNNVLFKIYPKAKIELYYENNFQLLIAIILSAQTTDKQVNKVNKNFFKILKSPNDWVKLWIDWIKNYIKSIWFYNSKSKNIFETCKILSKNNLDDFDSIEKLIKLPWVWIKTAKVFLRVVKNKLYLAVDTHVHRVLNRIWIVKTKTPLQTNKEIEKTWIEGDLSKLHHSLIFFWRYHCTARKPKCFDCKFKEICNYYISCHSWLE